MPSTSLPDGVPVSNARDLQSPGAMSAGTACLIKSIVLAGLSCFRPRTTLSPVRLFPADRALFCLLPIPRLWNRRQPTLLV
jgi:hypothetical protein